MLINTGCFRDPLSLYSSPFANQIVQVFFDVSSLLQIEERIRLGNR